MALVGEKGGGDDDREYRSSNADIGELAREVDASVLVLCARSGAEIDCLPRDNTYVPDDVALAFSLALYAWRTSRLVRTRSYWADGAGEERSVTLLDGASFKGFQIFVLGMVVLVIRLGISYKNVSEYMNYYTSVDVETRDITVGGTAIWGRGESNRKMSDNTATSSWPPMLGHEYHPRRARVLCLRRLEIFARPT